MRHGRWYPTQVLLADGRTVVMDGLDERGEPHVNPQIESYTPEHRLRHLAERPRAEPASRRRAAYTRTSSRCRAAACWSRARADRQLVLRSAGSEPCPGRTRPTRSATPGAPAVLLPRRPGGSTRVALIGGSRPRLAAGHGHLHPAPERDLRRGQPGRGLDARASAQRRPRAPQHRPAAGPLDGNGRRRLRDPEREPALGRPGGTPQHRALRPGHAAVDASAPPRTSCARITRPHSCCRTGACCPRVTTATAAARTTPPRSTSRPTCSGARGRRSPRRPATVTYGDTFTVGSLRATPRRRC